jgi:hypothetical protein
MQGHWTGHHQRRGLTALRSQAPQHTVSPCMQPVQSERAAYLRTQSEVQKLVQPLVFSSGEFQWSCFRVRD